MLQYKTIYPATLQLLKDLQALPLLQGTRLVGGTSLALQLGHRNSVDLDFFDDAESDPMPVMFNDVSWDVIKESIRQALLSL